MIREDAAFPVGSGHGIVSKALERTGEHLSADA